MPVGLFKFTGIQVTQAQAPSRGASDGGRHLEVTVQLEVARAAASLRLSQDARGQPASGDV